MDGGRSARSGGSRSKAPAQFEADLDVEPGTTPTPVPDPWAGEPSHDRTATGPDPGAGKAPDKAPGMTPDKASDKAPGTTPDKASDKASDTASDKAGTVGAADEEAAPQRRPRRRPPSRRRVWTGALVALIALAAGGGLAAWGVVQTDRARTAQDLADLSLAIAADPDAKRATATVATGGSVTLVVSGTRAALVARDLLILDSQHAYQVWLVRDNVVTPVSLGPTGTAAGAPWVRVVATVQPGDTIAISQEPAQGSTRPTGKPIAALKV